MLDENGGRNVFQKMLFLPKLVDVLKVVPNWHLEGKREDMTSKVVIFSSCIGPSHVLTHLLSL